MKINLKAIKKYFQEKISLIYSFLNQRDIKKLFSNIKKSTDNLEKKLNTFSNKIDFLNKYFFYIFVAFSICSYLLFKYFFNIGMGGDDSRIYMFKPTAYLEFAATNKRFAPLEAENNQHFYINTMTAMSFLETNFGFTYTEFYFLIFYLSFIFFYLVLKEVQKKFTNGNENKYIPFLLAILYPANPLMGDQIWNNHWISIFSIPATPLVLLIFLKIVFGNLNFKEALFYNLLLSILSIYFGGVIHPMVTFLILFIFIGVYIILNFKNLFKIIKDSVVFIALFLLTNFYWLYMLASNFQGNQFLIAVQSAAEGDTKNSLDYYGRFFDNTRFIYLNGVNASSYYDNFYEISSKLFFFLIIISIIIIFYKAFQKNEKNYIKLVIPFLSVFITSMYLQTISLTLVGQKLFLILCKYFFFLYGLRNYTTKVPPTYALFVLIIVLIAFYSIEKYKNITKTIFITILILFTTLSMRNLILLEDYKYNMPKGMVRNQEFDKDIYELSDFLKTHNEIERVTYLPMSTSTWSATQNGDKELYVGLSPLTIFSGVDDFNGYMYTDFMYGYFDDYKNLFIKAMNEEKIDNYLKHLSFIGTEAVIIDNDLIDMGYDRVINYKILNKNIKSNLEHIYTTKSGKYSIYKVPLNVLSFKSNIYKLTQEATSKTFYNFDFTKDTFTLGNLTEKYVNYDIKEINLNSKINKIEEVMYAKASNSKDITLNNTKLINIYNTKIEQIFMADIGLQDFIRVTLEGREKDYLIRFAYDTDEKSCIQKIFVRADTCENTSKPSFQEIDNKLVVSKRLTKRYMEPK